MTYATFLAAKTRAAGAVGHDVAPGDVHPLLFDWQAKVVRWSVRKGRCAVWLDCGMGKSPIQLEWARLSGDTALIMAPLSVARQTADIEAPKVGMDVRYIRSQAEVTGPGVYATNYEMAHAFDPSAFDAVVFDECFAPGTMVDTPAGRKPIESVRVGSSILNVSGIDVVADVHRREVPYAVRVKVNGQSVIASPNHPFLTQRGWVGAQDLQPLDYLVGTHEAMRLVREGVPGSVEEGDEPSAAAVLRSVLLSEMADEPARACGEGAHAGSSGQTRSGQESLVSVGFAAGRSGTGTDTQTQSDQRSGGTGQDFPHIEGHAPRSFRAWGKRDGVDRSTVEALGGTWSDVGSGVCFVTGSTDSRLSDQLQAGLGRSRATNQYRGGWVLPPQPARSRSEAGCQTGLTRVDGVEVYQPGDPRLDRWRDAEGRIYFYDLGATRHPSFSVGGHLVHNSSIVKHHTSETRRRLCTDWAVVPRRLACTATPAPNDIAELTNHAELLGVMPRAEMLAAYFIHDDVGWRLKGHAIEPMWKWISSWAITARRPSDLGYSDEGYLLPPLRIHEERVDHDIESPDQLFATDIGGVGGRAAVRRQTLDARVARAMSIMTDEPWIIWCGLNDEQDDLAKLLGSCAVSIYGSLTAEEKERRLLSWLAGDRPILLTKPAVCGVGLNLQRAHKMAFVGIGDSYEAYYQAIRRCYRFGQTEPVDAHIVVSAIESQIVANVRRKEQQDRDRITHLVRYSREELSHVDD